MLFGQLKENGFAGVEASLGGMQRTRSVPGTHNRRQTSAIRTTRNRFSIS